MAAAMRRAAEAAGAPVGAVLEGGYDLGALRRSVAATLEMLSADAAPAPDGEVPVHPLSVEARARAARYWPGLADAR
jgi:acetoin utilization deacetylase AcuC-like enzyme